MNHKRNVPLNPVLLDKQFLVGFDRHAVVSILEIRRRHDHCARARVGLRRVLGVWGNRVGSSGRHLRFGVRHFQIQ